MLIALIIFILIFSFLIISHELGHFLVAKKLGIKVEEFGIGYPPMIFGKKFGKTLYSVNWIPFGGFVKIHGEDPDEENTKDVTSFANRPPKQKAAVLLAGVTANFLVAIILFYFLLGFNGFQTYQGQFFDYQFLFGQQENFPVASQVIDNSPAALAGIESFDLILMGNEEKFENSDDVISFIDEHKGEEVSLSLKNIHTKEEKLVKLTPRIDPPENEGSIGISLSDVSHLKYESSGERISVGILHTVNLGHFSLYAMGNLIKTSFAERDINPISQNVTGPVGILVFTKLSMEGGPWQVFYLIAAISLALGIINILPIPAADGGRLVFVLYEVIFRRRAPAKLERRVNVVGFFILVILLFLVTFKDVLQFKDILF
ncbi:MAG: M50 family metallopeptidase [Patescibacteria group bacterium]|nr:M50 family metallopeptidase [Patescibacteria group bacterium]